MKFLIIQTGGLGAIVLSTPVFRCLKKQLPDAQIHLLANAHYKSVVQHNPYINQIHFLQGSGKDTVQELKELEFEHIIDLQNESISKRIAKHIKAPVHIYDKLPFQTAVFTRLKLNIMSKVHVTDRYMETVKPFGVYNDGKGLDYFIDSNDEVRQHDIPTSHQAGYVVVIVGGNFKTKKLPVEKLKELCQKINHPLILIGGADDVPVGYEICKLDPIKIYNACGKFSLNETADLIRKSKLVISHDTGLMHVSAALKKQLIVVWGSTTPSLGAEPYYGDQYLTRNARPFDNLQVHKLWCRPCTTRGKQHCPQRHFKCMKKMDIDEIVRRVNIRLGRA